MRKRKESPHAQKRSELRYVSGRIPPELHQSARKHYRRDRLTDESVLYAFAHALSSWPLDDEDDPRRWLMIGTDHVGRALELVMLAFDDGREMIIHAMKARPKYLDRL